MTMWYEFLTFQWRHMSIMVSQVMVNSTALSTGCWGPTRKTSKLSITGLEGVHRRLGWCVASVHWWTGSALVQVKVCRLFGAKTLLWLLPTNCQLRPWEQTSVKFYVASRWLCYLIYSHPHQPMDAKQHDWDFPIVTDRIDRMRSVRILSADKAQRPWCSCFIFAVFPIPTLLRVAPLVLVRQPRWQFSIPGGYASSQHCQKLAKAASRLWYGYVITSTSTMWSNY